MIAVKPWQLWAGGAVVLLLLYSRKSSVEGAPTGLLGDAAKLIANTVSNAVGDITGGVVDGVAQGVGSLAGNLAVRVTPWDSRNVANQAVLSAGRTATGDENWSLGGWVWEKTHPGFDPAAGKTCTNFMGFGCP